MFITPNQIRAARALKNWSQSELAERTGLAVPTIANIEAGKQEPSARTLERIIDVFQIGGVKFTSTGVVFDEDEVFSLSGEGKFIFLLKDIEKTLANRTDKEVLFFGYDERRSSPEEIKLYQHLSDQGIVQKKIHCDARDKGFADPKIVHKAMAVDYFDDDGAVVIYGNKVAYYTIEKDGNPPMTIIIRNQRIANNYKKLFAFIWDHLPR